MNGFVSARRVGVREGLLLLALGAVPVGIALARPPEPAAAVAVASVAGGVAGAVFLVASLLLYLDWRIHSTPGKAWMVAAMVLLACHLLGSAALAMDAQAAARRELGWPLVVDLAVTGAVVVLGALALEGRPPLDADPLLAGVTFGLLFTVAKPLLVPVDAAVPVAPGYLVAAIVIAYATLAVAIVLRHSVPRWLAWRLSGTLVLVSAVHAAASPLLPSPLLDVTAGTLLACAGLLWAGVGFAMLRDSMEEEHRRLVEVETSLLAMEGSQRGTREALHELKSTVSGLAKASQLLSDGTIAPDARLRLEQSLWHELSRMERLLWKPAGPEPTVTDLDETLDDVLQLHLVRGREFSWTPSGTSVVGQPDAIAEAVNILLDNAATHGDAASGRVEVSVDETDTDMVRIAISDDGPGVPPEMHNQIFEWGQRGPGSTGQGIGLHVARRLVTEQGGSLSLSENDTGSSFVIRLPAARRSEENHHADTQHSAV